MSRNDASIVVADGPVAVRCGPAALAVSAGPPTVSVRCELSAVVPPTGDGGKWDFSDSAQSGHLLTSGF